MIIKMFLISIRNKDQYIEQQFNLKLNNQQKLIFLPSIDDYLRNQINIKSGKKLEKLKSNYFFTFKNNFNRKIFKKLLFLIKLKYLKILV